MNQQEVEQWIAQNGGQGRVQYQRSTQRVPNPAAKMTLPDGSDNPDYDPMAARANPTIEVSEEKWVAFDDQGKPTGAELNVRRRPDGDFDIINQANPNPTKPASGTDTRNPDQKEADRIKVEEAQREAAERAKNRSLPPDQDPRDETDAQRAARADATRKEQAAKAERDAATARQARIDEQTAATNAAREQRATAEANKATTTSRNVTGGDGKPYIQIITTSADGKTTSVRNIGPDGKDVAEIPGETKFAVEPPGAPPASTQYGAIVAGLPKYRDFLNQQVAAGTLTTDAADKLMQTRLAQAKALHEEQQGVIDTQTGIAGQGITQRGQTLNDESSRRTAASTVYTNVLNQFTPLLQYMPNGGGQAFLDLLQHGTEAGLNHIRDVGGFKDVPEVQLGPAAQAANNAQMPGGTFMTPYQPPQAAPITAAPAVPTPPNAIGAGAVESMAAPGQVAPTVPPAPLADPNAPPPPLISPMQAPGAGPTAKYTDPWGNELELTQDQFNNRPGGSSDLTPVVANSFMAPYQQPALPGGAQMMWNDPDMDNAALARAYREVYGTDLVVPGMAA